MATITQSATSYNTENTSSKKINVQSNDPNGKIYEIDEGIIEQSSTIKELSDSLGFDEKPIPLLKVNEANLTKIIQFCEHHKNDPKPELLDDDDDDDPNKDIYEPKRSDDISEWDQEFIKQFTVADGTLFDIIMASNYLGIKTLLAVGCKTIANMVRGKASTEVREMFDISHDPPGEGLNAVEAAPEANQDSTTTA